MKKRLDWVLVSQGIASRRESTKIIKAGRVKVASDIVKSGAEHVETDDLVFSVDDELFEFREHVYLILHKPLGYECSHKPQVHDSVFSLIPPQLLRRGVECIGRLDVDTTGLLLLSDDGTFLHKVSSPSYSVNKCYLVTLEKPVSKQQCDELLAGVLLNDEKKPLAAVSALALSEFTCELTIKEGKYHQVKRMFAAVGNKVLALHRKAMGGLELDNGLKLGQWDYMTASQHAKLGILEKRH